jgi:molybdate transport system ATP-binding protein
VSCPPALEAHFVLEVGRFILTAELVHTSGVLALYGPSGAGKSLTLSALAGLLRPSRGHIRLGGAPLFDAERRVHLPAHRRQVGYVPQHHALLPFLDVRQNVAFGLPRAERRARSAHVEGLLEELGLVHLAHARPTELSGGERQRVALARALAVRPRLLLLDEPFASLDAPARKRLQRVLRTTLLRHHTPALLVTHDATEALALADAVLLYERGRTTRMGPAAALLGAAAPLEVQGQVVGAVRTLGEGQVEVQLSEATVRGPAHALRPSALGALRLKVRAEEGEEGA